MDMIIYGGVALLVVWIVMKVAWYTVKRVATNIALGFITYLGVTQIFHIPLEMNFLMWVLTALLGPIPVLIMAYMHW